MFAELRVPLWKDNAQEQMKCLTQAKSLHLWEVV
jgi:hypothetical protein